MSHIDVVRSQAGDENEVGTLFSVPPGHVSLAVGAPSRDLLERAQALVTEGVNEMAKLPNTFNFLQYGPIRGDAGLLHALAKFLSNRYSGAPVDPDRLVITAGASAAFLFLCSYFGSRSSSKCVFLEDPCYFLASSVVADCGLKGVGVASDAEGLSVTALREALETNGMREVSEAEAASTSYAALVYAIPDFCNPTGRVMSEQRRRDLVALAQAYNILVVCDDVYTLLDLDGPRSLPPRLVSFDASVKGHVVSNGSFSKVLAPGIRVGWMETGPHVLKCIDHSGFGASGGCPTQFTSGAIRTLLRAGRLDEHLDAVRLILLERKRAMCEAMRMHWPASVCFQEPAGGFFVWCTLPEGRDAADFLQQCKTNCRIGFVAGAWTSVSGGSKNCMRLSFAHYPAAELAEHVRVVGDELHAFLST